MTFKKGDIVKYIGSGNPKNLIGIVKYVAHSSYHYHVEFDKNFKYGHSCQGSCKNRQGWGCNADELQIIKPKYIKDGKAIDKLKRLLEL